jgi:hypothetical protein
LNSKIAHHATSGWFSDFDVFELDISLSKLVDKNINKEEALKSLADTLLSALKAGEYWMLNPTLSEIAELTENLDPIESVISFIRKKSGGLIFEEIDIKKKYVKTSLRVRIICKNVVDFISASKDVKVEDGYVQTALFKFPLR